MIVTSYDGICYFVEYKIELSNNTTQKRVWHIRTKDKNYNHVREAIKIIMKDMVADESDNIEILYHLETNVIFDKTFNMYLYTFVGPYDD